MTDRMKYIAKSGKEQWKPSMDWCAEDNNEGFCLACGQFHEGFEPDTRKAKCPSCGEMKVYGNEELALMNLCF